MLPVLPKKNVIDCFYKYLNGLMDLIWLEVAFNLDLGGYQMVFEHPILVGHSILTSNRDNNEYETKN